MVDVMNTSTFYLLFYLIAFIVIGGFIYFIINSLLNFTASPVTITAKLIGKDTAVSRHNDNHSLTTYTLIFEESDGKRMNLDVKKSVYHQYVVGDSGQLTYKRQWFVAFELNQ